MSRNAQRSERSELRTTTPSLQANAEDHITDNGLRVSSSLRSDSPRSWLSPFFRIWREIFGGEPCGGELARYLRPLVVANGSPAVETAFQRYCEETAARYVSPSRFAQTFGRWRDDASGHEAVNGPVTFEQAQDAFRKAGLLVPKLPAGGFSSRVALNKAIACQRARE